MPNASGTFAKRKSFKRQSLNAGTAITRGPGKENISPGFFVGT
jgi:hypothetical protein